MSAAVNNLVMPKEFTRAYEGLLRHYRINGQKIQAGQANENGDVEQRHYRFKQAADQALMMRGSRDFAAVAAYTSVLGQVVHAVECRPDENDIWTRWHNCGRCRSSGSIRCGENGFESVRAV